MRATTKPRPPGEMTHRRRRRTMGSGSSQFSGVGGLTDWIQGIAVSMWLLWGAASLLPLMRCIQKDHPSVVVEECFWRQFISSLVLPVFSSVAAWGYTRRANWFYKPVCLEINSPIDPQELSEAMWWFVFMWPCHIILVPGLTALHARYMVSKNGKASAPTQVFLRKSVHELVY